MLPFLDSAPLILQQADAQRIVNPIRVDLRIASFSFHTTGDYYPLMRIGTFGSDGSVSPLDDVSSAPPPTLRFFPWRVGTSINPLLSGNIVPIYINIYDYDNAILDRHVNVNGQNRVGQIAVNLDLRGGTVTGDGIQGRANVGGAGGTIFESTGPDGTIRFTIGYEQSKLKIIKILENNDGRDKDERDFTINVRGQNVRIAQEGAGLPVLRNTFPASSQTQTVFVNPGNYAVTEIEDPGYSTTYSRDCTGIIRPGEEVTCTISNDDIPVTVPPYEIPIVPALPPQQGGGSGGSGGGGDGGAGPSPDVTGTEMEPEEREQEARGEGFGNGSAGP